MCKKLIRNFIICGFLGWCMEILFTSLESLKRRDLSLRGNTSLWMFPIYGSAVLLAPFFALLRKCSVFFRGMIYAVLIFIFEFLSGRILRKHGLCPWDYSRSKLQIDGLIRLDFFPLWFLAGLLFERVLSCSGPASSFRSTPAKSAKHSLRRKGQDHLIP